MGGTCLISGVDDKLSPAGYLTFRRLEPARLDLFWNHSAVTEIPGGGRNVQIRDKKKTFTNALCHSAEVNTIHFLCNFIPPKVVKCTTIYLHRI